MALWSGRFTENVSEFTQRFGASLPVDKALYAQDIAGSKAHAAMLGSAGVIAQADIDSLAGEPTIADVNALLNSHPKVKNLELEKRDGDNARDARTYAQTRDDIEDDGYTPANYTRRR